MSFLAPLFLAGGLAIALPVLFHLVRRTTRERKVFSSLQFLLPTPPRLSRRSRLEHLLLLLLRCAALCLLAFGFARPFFRHAAGQAGPAAARRTLILLDTSASMRRPNLWSDARSKAESLLRGAAPVDQVALAAFDWQMRPLLSFDQWNSAPAGERAALALGKLAETSPGWTATHLGNALISAAELLAESNGKQGSGPGQILLLTDLQEGSRLDGLQGYAWPKDVELVVEMVKPRQSGNAGLQLVGEADEGVSKAAPGVRVRVSNCADSAREQFRIGWTGADGHSLIGKQVEVYVPAGQSRIVNLPLPAVGAASDHIRLQGDDQDFDNSLYVLPPERGQAKVLYLGRDMNGDAQGPLYFLSHALQETRRQSIQVIARAAEGPLPSSDAASADLVVITAPLPNEMTRELREQIASGKVCLFALPSAAATATLARLLDLPQLEATEVTPASYAMLADLDFQHPLLAPFADPRFSDFTKIHFWKYRKLDTAALPQTRVLAKFDSGDAALVEVPLGKGRVFVLTAGWQPSESQLALSSKFVPLLYTLLEESGARVPLPPQYHVGDMVPLNLAATAQPTSATLRVPDGSELKPDGTNFAHTLTPGVYSVVTGQSQSRFAVNVDPAESRTAPLALEELERLGAPLSQGKPAAAVEAERKIHWQSAELENRQKLWRWLLAGAMVLLLAETWLAGRTARNPMTNLEKAGGAA